MPRRSRLLCASDDPEGACVRRPADLRIAILPVRSDNPSSLTCVRTASAGASRSTAPGARSRLPGRTASSEAPSLCCADLQDHLRAHVTPLHGRAQEPSSPQCRLEGWRRMDVLQEIYACAHKRLKGAAGRTVSVGWCKSMSSSRRLDYALVSKTTPS